MGEEWRETPKISKQRQRARAFRLRKKQEKFGAKAQLRPYHQVEKNLVEISKNLVKSSLKMSCNNCGAESIGGPQHIGGSCYRIFCEGRLVAKE